MVGISDHPRSEQSRSYGTTSSKKIIFNGNNVNLQQPQSSQQNPLGQFKQMVKPYDNKSAGEAVKLKSENLKYKNFNFDKNLALTVKTQNKYFQLNSSQDQTIPIMVSLQANESISNESESVRQPIDLVCVIDNSGSMDGNKIENVKRALTYLLSLLTNNDRICLIVFNSDATQLCKLIRVDDVNRQSIEYQISQIRADGGTDINAGMNLAFNVLETRQQRNEVSSIFLLSDGQDSKATIEVTNSLLSNNLRENCFTINTFGFGDDHDAQTMIDICNLKDGSFYYVQDINSIDEFFCDAIGGLFSVVAQEIEIEVKLNLKKESKKYFKNATVSKLYGTQWREIEKDQFYKIKMNKLISGVSKDFIFELNIPAQQVSSIEDNDRNVEIINVSVNLTPVNHEYTTRYSKSNKLILTLYKENEMIPMDSELNKEVEFNYLRVKCSDAMEQALKLQSQTQHSQAEQLVTNMVKQISRSSTHAQQKLQQTKNELIQLNQELKSRQHLSNNQVTSYLSSITANYNQSGGHELGRFSNNAQLSCIQNSQNSKKSSLLNTQQKPTSEQKNKIFIKAYQQPQQLSSNKFQSPSKSGQFLSLNNQSNQNRNSMFYPQRIYSISESNNDKTVRQSQSKIPKEQQTRFPPIFSFIQQNQTQQKVYNY